MWWDGLLEAVNSLEELPGRCPTIPEAKHFPGELRHLLYASHRIIFEVEPGLVTVLRVYHGARKALRLGREESRAHEVKHSAKVAAGLLRNQPRRIHFRVRLL